MPILDFLIDPIAQSGKVPNFIYIDTNDPYATVTGAGYLNKFVAQGNLINDTEMALVATSPTPNGTKSVNLFKVVFSSGQWSLMPNNPPTPTVGGWIWNSVFTNTALVAGNAYVNTGNTMQITYSLPSVANFGDSYLVAGYGAGNWQIAPSGLQEVILGGSIVTSGHTLTSTSGTGVAALIVCVAANTSFLIYSASGAINIV